MKKAYDVLVIGPVSLDHNIDYQGNERREVGGAVVASGFAAAKSGNRTAVFTKLNPADADVEERFAGSGADVYWKPSAATCSIRNQYFTADKEKRSCTSMGVCDPFRFDELPDVETKIYHFAGLVYGDFDGEILEKAARLFHKMGAKEILITHNTEVLAYDGENMYTCPIKARNLSGRTGRGDTAFAGYIAARQEKSVEEALLYCTALVSLKMETPGPFRGTRQDVLRYMREFYKEMPALAAFEEETK